MEREWSEDELDLFGDFVSYWYRDAQQITAEELIWTTKQMNRIKRLRERDPEWEGWVSASVFTESSILRQFGSFPDLGPWTDVEMQYLAKYVPEREQRVPKSYTAIANEMSELFKDYHRPPDVYNHQNIRTIMVRHFATITATPLTIDEAKAVDARLPRKYVEYSMQDFKFKADSLNQHPVPLWVWDAMWCERRPRRRFTQWNLMAWVFNRERQQMQLRDREQSLQ